MSETPTAFMVEANGPDLLSARMLPPASSLERSLDAGVSFSRQGLTSDIQERLIGINRKLDVSALQEVLSSSRKDENMMFAAAAQMLSPGGPSNSMSPSPFGGVSVSPGPASGPSSALSSRRGLDFRPAR